MESRIVGGSTIGYSEAEMRLEAAVFQDIETKNRRAWAQCLTGAARQNDQLGLVMFTHERVFRVHAFGTASDVVDLVERLALEGEGHSYWLAANELKDEVFSERRFDREVELAVLFMPDLGDVLATGEPHARRLAYTELLAERYGAHGTDTIVDAGAEAFVLDTATSVPLLF